MDEDDLYPRVGRQKKFQTTRTPTFAINPPPHYIMMPNSDFRHKMPLIMGDFMRHGNLKGLESFLTEHCAPEVQFMTEFDGEKNPHGPNIRVVVGVKGIVELFTYLLNASPDIVSVIEDIMGFYDPKSGTSV